MKLFYSPGACSLAPHIALEELGIKYEAVKEDLRNKDPEYVKMNPKGYVPAIMTDQQKLLTENQVVLRYLADQKPEANMIPKAGTWERYKAEETLNFIATELHKGFGPLFGAASMHPNDESAQKQLKEAATKKLEGRFQLIAEHLKGGKFLLGDNISVADCYLFVTTLWAKKMSVQLPPEVMAFSERMQSRPAVQKTLQAEGLM